MIKVGVLALQGAVAEHIRLLEKAGAEAIAVKKVYQLDEIDGLVIPGGESTTIGKLIKQYGFDQALQSFHESKKADIWYLCRFDYFSQGNRRTRLESPWVHGYESSKECIWTAAGKF